MKPPVCRNCFKAEGLKGRCWYQWEGKRVCTRWGRSMDEERYVDARPLIDKWLEQLRR